MKSNWLQKQTSLYENHFKTTGRSVSYQEILFSSFKSNMKEIEALRDLDIVNDPEYKQKSKVFKSKLQGFTPAALLESREKGNVKVIERTALMQFDFDYKDIKDYDIEELKQAVFYPLPFIAYCGLSCSGTGFYALALISEPEKLEAYAEHCFEILKEYGIKPDESKGKKVENLRYISYDKNHLFRENPDPLHVIKFRTKKKPTYSAASFISFENNNEFIEHRIKKSLESITQAQPGQRMNTIQRCAYTLGGFGKPELLEAIQAIIINNSIFYDQEPDFIKCAINCFNAGSLKPII